MSKRRIAEKEMHVGLELRFSLVMAGLDPAMTAKTSIQNVDARDHEQRPGNAVHQSFKNSAAL
jgi:hypothetical protein